MDGVPCVDTGLPVSNIYTDQGDSRFYLNICEMTKSGLMITDVYIFRIGKKVTVEFMGKMYSPWEEYELIKLHDTLETELALARLD